MQHYLETGKPWSLLYQSSIGLLPMVTVLQDTTVYFGGYEQGESPTSIVRKLG